MSVLGSIKVTKENSRIPIKTSVDSSYSPPQERKSKMIKINKNKERGL
jgi:hypothetical protein